jgi:hypothetical protein
VHDARRPEGREVPVGEIGRRRRRSEAPGREPGDEVVTPQTIAPVGTVTPEAVGEAPTDGPPDAVGPADGLVPIARDPEPSDRSAKQIRRGGVVEATNAAPTTMTTARRPRAPTSRRWPTPPGFRAFDRDPFGDGGSEARWRRAEPRRRRCSDSSSSR